ncbi:hypothetical protein AVEN_255099-1 [Araneus ventricosus]|uniref:Uncharacterized protein n=1 Tax=Araneus ventricosus TaxID=182803 RepID=A0A4Y2EG42_ARAVE|nr:hypothetical protein AVEN_255099-1 [Araneus ventricosus]
MTECVSLLLHGKEERKRGGESTCWGPHLPFLLNDHPPTGVFALPVGNEKLFPLSHSLGSFKCGKVPGSSGDEEEEPRAEGGGKKKEKMRQGREKKSAKICCWE